MIYHVILKFEDAFVVEADSEDEAISTAMQDFDPTIDEPSVVEVWSDNDE